MITSQVDLSTYAERFRRPTIAYICRSDPLGRRKTTKYLYYNIVKFVSPGNVWVGDYDNIPKGSAAPHIWWTMVRVPTVQDTTWGTSVPPLEIDRRGSAKTECDIAIDQQNNSTHNRTASTIGAPTRTHHREVCVKLCTYACGDIAHRLQNSH